MASVIANSAFSEVFRDKNTLKPPASTLGRHLTLELKQATKQDKNWLTMDTILTKKTTHWIFGQNMFQPLQRSSLVVVECTVCNIKTCLV